MKVEFTYKDEPPRFISGTAVQCKLQGFRSDKKKKPIEAHITEITGENPVALLNLISYYKDTAECKVKVLDDN